MKNTFRLKFVQDLAQKKSDEAATRLGMLNAEVAKAEQKLQMLLDYREEYRERFRGTVQRDVGTAEFRNFQQFLEKLEEAIEQQRAAILVTRDNVARGQREWQVKQIEVKAYDTLEQRHESAVAERLKKIDQRVTDEFAGRAHHQRG